MLICCLSRRDNIRYCLFDQIIRFLTDSIEVRLAQQAIIFLVYSIIDCDMWILFSVKEHIVNCSSDVPFPIKKNDQWSHFWSQTHSFHQIFLLLPNHFCLNLLFIDGEFDRETTCSFVIHRLLFVEISFYSCTHHHRCQEEEKRFFFLIDR